MKEIFHTIDRLEVNILLGESFTDEIILSKIEQSMGVVPCDSKPFSLNPPKTTNPDIIVSTAGASKIEPAKMTATKTLVKLRVAR